MRVQTERLGYIDCLRGGAVAMVVAVHVSHWVPGGTNFARWAQYGQYGVQLFFVLSALSLCIATERRPSDGYGAFLGRRVFRIAPMYYVALLLFFLISLAIERVGHGTAFFTPTASYTPFKVGANLLLLHGLVPAANNNMVPGGWSIGCEFLFYAIFPLLYRAMQRHFGYLLLVAVGGGLVSWGLSAVPAVGPLPGFLFYSLPMQLPCFLVGMSIHRFEKRAAFRIGLGLLAPAAGWFLLKAQHVSSGWQISPLLAAIFFGGVVVGARKWIPAGPPALRAAGRASYSVYCLHYAFVRLVAQPGSAWWTARGGDGELIAWSAFGITLLLSVGTALLTYRWIERPFIEWSRRLGGSVRTTPPVG